MAEPRRFLGGWFAFQGVSGRGKSRVRGGGFRVERGGSRAVPSAQHAALKTLMQHSDFAIGKSFGAVRTRGAAPISARASSPPSSLIMTTIRDGLGEIKAVNVRGDSLFNKATISLCVGKRRRYIETI